MNNTNVVLIQLNDQQTSFLLNPINDRLQYDDCLIGYALSLVGVLRQDGFYYVPTIIGNGLIKKLKES